MAKKFKLTDHHFREFSTSRKELSRRDPIVEFSLHFKYPKMKHLSGYDLERKLEIVRTYVFKKRSQTINRISNVGGRFVIPNPEDSTLHAKVRYGDIKEIVPKRSADVVIRSIDGVEKI